MAISTYSDLVTAVTDWMTETRTAVINRIPDFIMLAEAKMNRELLVRQMDQRATTSVDTSTDEPEYVTMPSDVQTLRRVALSGETGQPELQYVSPVQFNDMRFTYLGGSTGKPQFYTTIGDELELLPVPDQDYEIELVYRKNIPALTADSATNWLLTLAPDLYLYATLREAFIFTQDDDRIPLAAQGYASAVDSLNKISGAFNSAPLAMRVMGGATP